MCALLLICCVPAVPALAAGHRWVSKRQPDASVTALVMSRSNESLLYLAAYGGGIFRSIDAGENWKAINAGIADNRIVSLAMDPIVPATLYAGSESGRIFSTINGGEQWQEIPSFTKNAIATIVVAGDNTIYAVTHGSIFRSSDAGVSWIESNKGLVGNVEALSIVPSTPRRLFAATATGLFTTSDRGDSWNRVEIPDVGHINGVAVSDDGQTIYVNSGDFHTSIDGGRTWKRVPGNGASQPKGMAIDRSRGSTAWATTFDRRTRTYRVYRTTDSGSTWHPLNFADEIQSLVLNGDTAYAGTPIGVQKTTDAARSWIVRSSGLSLGFASDVVMDAANAKLMYAATRAGIFKTTDGGNAWTRSGDFSYALSVAIDPNNSSVVFASNFDHTTKTTDGGETWTEIQPNPKKLAGARAIAVDPSNPSTVYAVLWQEGLSKSIDGGSTFAFINAGLPEDFYYGVDSSALAIDSASPSTLFASNVAISKSTNGGLQWTPVSSGQPIWWAMALAIEPSRPEVVYAATLQGLFRSKNGGGSWERLVNGLTTEHFTDVVINPSRHAVVYVSTQDSGVFKSTDRGETWTSFNQGLPATTVHALAIDATGTFLAAATEAGVFTFSSDDDASLPAELHATRLRSDPARLTRLLEQVRGLNGSHPITSDSNSAGVGLLFAAAGDVAGAFGTRFRSDVTLRNGNTTSQDVAAIWLGAGADGTDAPAFRLTLAPSAITVTNFVAKMGVSGLGSLLFIAIDANENLDASANLRGFSRIWTAGPGGRGTVSQAFPPEAIRSLGGNSAAEVIGLRTEADFRSNIGIVNLDTISHNFLVSLTGERTSASVDVAIPPFSMQQISVPAGDYGALTALVQVAAGDFPWTAYGSSVDNLTGDGWAAQAGKTTTVAPTGFISGVVRDSSRACIHGALVEGVERSDGVPARFTAVVDCSKWNWYGEPTYEFFLPAGVKLRLRASMRGYQTKEETFVATLGPERESDIVLSPEQ